MFENCSFEDFYRYFARWESAFAGGVPVAYVSSPPVSALNLRAVFVANQGEVGTAEKELFTGIVTKGLQWSMKECELIEAEEASLQESLSRITEDGVVVFLGQVPESIEALIPNDIRAISTHSLQEVLADSSLKRPLWEAMKPLSGKG